MHYGDNIIVVNPGPSSRSENPRAGAAALAVNMTPSALHNASGLTEDCGVSGTQNTEPTSRTCFTIVRYLKFL